MKRLVAFVIALIILCGGINVSATVTTEYYSDDLMANTDTLSANSAVEGEYKSAVLIEKDTGKVLFESNPHERLAPASITKIMSLLLICEAIQGGKLKLTDSVGTSEYAASMGGSQIWLEPGETMTVDELLRATVIASANDATVALAEAVAGSEESFVQKMNQKAKELKLENTNFVNCSGLDAENHYSSAYDIAVMSIELLKHDLIKKYTTVWMDSLRNGESELVNTNKLVRFYSGATGLKTGTTSSAGFCVSGSAEKDGMELCAVIMGAKNNDGRFGNAKKLLNYGFANWKITEVKVPSKKIPTVKVEKGCEGTLELEVAGVGKYLLNKENAESVELKVNAPESIPAPIAKGQKIGSVDVILGKEKLGSIDLISKNEVKKFTFLVALDRILSALLTL